MSFLIIYAVAIIMIMTSYLFANNDLSISDFYDTYKFLKEKTSQLVVTKKEFRIDIDAKSSESNVAVVLNNSLKHLEFISQFESYMESSDHALLSPEFIKEFKTSKLNTQLSILKSTKVLSALSKIAA